MDYHQEVDDVVEVCKTFGVRVGVLALVLQSVRYRHKTDRFNSDYDPSSEELENIRHLKQSGVDYIGLTSDDYVDRPDKMIGRLYEIIEKC